jgi:hypothetical protein
MLSLKRKVRGQNRKCKLMRFHIFNETEEFPQESEVHPKFWHLHLPVAQRFIDSLSTPNKLRKYCMKILIERTIHLLKKKPKQGFFKVVSAISLPDLFDSQIVVFFQKEYWDNFFNRNSDFQKWIPLPSKRSLLKEINLNPPFQIFEKGYKETITDEDFEHNGEIWFIGDEVG